MNQVCQSSHAYTRKEHGLGEKYIAAGLPYSLRHVLYCMLMGRQHDADSDPCHQLLASGWAAEPYLAGLPSN